MNKDHVMLITGGVMNIVIGLTHIVIPFVGSKAYLFFGAGESMVKAAEESPLIPGAITITLGLVFIIFGAYAWSGAQRLPRMPLLHLVLAGISGVFILRGIQIPLNIYGYLIKKEPLQYTFFSLVALLVGLLYLWPTAQLWKSLKPESQ